MTGLGARIVRCDEPIRRKGRAMNIGSVVVAAAVIVLVTRPSCQFRVQEWLAIQASALLHAAKINPYIFRIMGC